MEGHGSGQGCPVASSWSATPVRPGGGQDGERMQRGLTKFPFWGKKTWFHFRGLCTESEEVVR